MDKYEYLHLALSLQAYKRNAWMLRAFAVSNLSPYAGVVGYDCELFDVEGQYGFVHPASQELVVLKDTSVEMPLFDKRHGIDITPENTPNCIKPERVSVGNLVFNHVALIYPFGKKIPFISGKVDIGALENRLVKILEDDVENPADERSDRIYVRELITFIDSVASLTSYNQVFVPSATPYTMTAAPEAVAYVAEFIKNNRERMNDPVVVAELVKEVERLDRAYIDLDPNKGFYRKTKSFAVVRMRMHYLFGIEAAFDGSGEFKFIENSLGKGWDMKYFPEMNNSSRDGSYKRGAETAFSGKKVKTAFSSMGGTIASEEDCGTKAGLTTYIKDSSKYIGNRVFDSAGKETLLTEDNHTSFAGTTVFLRNPGMCITKDSNYCIACSGEFIRGRETTITALSSTPSSQMMGASMGAMHGKALKAVLVNFEDVFM